MITYSTNWMGPISIQWFIDRNLTVKKEINSEHFGHHVVNEIVEPWSGGRIDIRGTGDPYGDEIGLPVMHGEDFQRFSLWLREFETKTVWTLKQLTDEYEKTHSKIRWASETFKNLDN